MHDILISEGEKQLDERGFAMKIHHILVIMDPTIDQQPALFKAIEVAKRFDASIELFLVVHHSALSPKWFSKEHSQEQIINQYLQTKQRWLDTYLSLVTAENISVSSEVRWHTPLYAEILKKITECHADMVVKTTHQHPVIDRLLFTPNDWQLLKSCPVPLLLVKATSQPIYKNIMAAVDLKHTEDEFINLDEVIIETTAMMVEYFHAVGHVTHAYDPMGYELWPTSETDFLGFDLPSYDYKSYQNQRQEYHEKEFNQLVAHYGFDEKNIHSVNGIAAYQLIDTIKDEKIDLLIMGVRFHSGFVSSTAEKILDEVSCDILAIKATY
jgi:universal stress protein E